MTPTTPGPTVTLADVQAAAAGLAGALERTPCSHSETLSAITGAQVWCKYENQQYTASFKERGARWFLLGLDDTARARGVVAASAGNHAQGVARHARLLGIEATIVMPESTPFTKVSRTELEGATVVLHGAGFAEAQAHARTIVAERGAVFVPAFDDPRVVAGQGTCALEVLDQVPDIDTLVVPVGGGGLLAGCAVAARGLRPDIRIVGVQSDTHPAFAAAHAGRAIAAVSSTTIAEGIAVAHPGAITLELARALVDEIVVVGEPAIEAAVAQFVEIEKTVVEGAGAVGLAALMQHRDRFAGRRCAVIVSGGNIDLRVLSSVVLRALAVTGRIVHYTMEITDRPGMLALVAGIIGGAGGNIVDVEHHRDRPGVPVREAVLEVSVETRDPAHAVEIGRRLTEAGLLLRPGSPAPA
jgi:threonine dehydratase